MHISGSAKAPSTPRARSKAAAQGTKLGGLTDPQQAIFRSLRPSPWLAILAPVATPPGRGLVGPVWALGCRCLRDSALSLYVPVVVIGNWPNLSSPALAKDSLPLRFHPHVPPPRTPRSRLRSRSGPHYSPSVNMAGRRREGGGARLSPGQGNAGLAFAKAGPTCGDPAGGPDGGGPGGSGQAPRGFGEWR